MESSGILNHKIVMVCPEDQLADITRICKQINRYYDIRWWVKSENYFAIADMKIWIDQRRVNIQGHSIDFTANEFSVLCLLAKHPRKVFTKYQIYDAVWNEPSESVDNIVICTIYGIRSKIRNITDRQFIHTVRGVGYKFEE